MNIVHGMSDTKIYAVWRAMKQRCFNPSNLFYKDYGGRGITVCKRWLVFSNFYIDMGDSPSPKHSLHRKHNDRNYSKNNCKWALWVEQNNHTRFNRMIRYRGFYLSVSAWTTNPPR